MSAVYNALHASTAAVVLASAALPSTVAVVLASTALPFCTLPSARPASSPYATLPSPDAFPLGTFESCVLPSEGAAPSTGPPPLFAALHAVKSEARRSDFTMSGLRPCLRPW
jgi:hypothetical protein